MDRRTSNTMAKRKGQKDKQHNDQKKRTEGQATLFLLSFSLGHCFACPSVLFFWSLCCLSFCPFLLFIQWPKENDRRTSNTMAKRKGQKDKQHNGQKKMTDGQAK
jgi:amino acid permease